MVNNTKSNMNFDFEFGFSIKEKITDSSTDLDTTIDENIVINNCDEKSSNNLTDSRQTGSSMCQKFYTLIDGSGFIFRAFYAVKANMTDSDGTPVNAVYGYCSMLLKLIEEKLHNNIPDESEIIAVIFDSARYNFRNEIYPKYKANRSETPPELIPQFSMIRQATKAFGLPSIEMNMYEADDIIATYARQISDEGNVCRIVSSDKDLMQLIDDDKNIFVYDSMKDKVLHERDAFEKFSVPAKKIPDVQALIGDASDNIPGVMGIGPKTAADLINTFGSMEGIYDNISDVKSEKQKDMLLKDRGNAFVSKRLAVLKDDVPIHINVADFNPSVINFDSLIVFCEKLNFKSIISRALKLKSLMSTR